jgi:hypothetical protein
MICASPSVTSENLHWLSWIKCSSCAALTIYLQILRRLARVTQWCSAEVTHTENGTGNEMQTAIIHAAGVCVCV